MSKAEDDEISIKEIIVNIQRWVLYLWSKRIILFVASFVGGALGVWYAFVKTPVYTATTTFVVETGDSRRGLGGLAGMAAMAGINLGGSAGGLFQGDNILELYKSRRMLVRALLTPVTDDSTELLIDRYMDYAKIRKSWGDRPDLLALDFHQDPSSVNLSTRRLQDSVLTAFSNHIRKDVLSVDKPDKDLSIVYVNITAPDEVFAKSFNDALVKEVSEFYIQTKIKNSTDNIVILEAKVDSLREEMRGAIYSAAHTADATPNLNPTRQVQRVAPTQEAQYSAEANRVMLSQLLQNLELTRMAQLQEQPLIQLVDQPVYPLPIEQFGKKKGVIIGGLLAGFLTLLILMIIKWYRDIMAEDTE